MVCSEAFIFIYLISIIWIALGAIVGWFIGKSPIGMIVMLLLFGVVGFLIFPGMWGGV